MYYTLWLAIVVPLIVSVVIWVYSRLTCGKCRCDRRAAAGKTVLITGGNKGIGRCCVEELCRGGAHVIIGCRDIKQGYQVREECLAKGFSGSVEVFALDLQSFSSVREFVERVKSRYALIDVIVNNAGIGVPERLIDTPDGFEMTYQTNYLAPVLLTHLLLPQLRRPGRIVNVSSIQYQMGSNRRLRKCTACSMRTPLFGSFVYGDSKLALNHWTRTLAKKLRGTGISVVSCHPGFVKTDIFFGHYGNLMHFVLGKLTHIFAKSPLEGAQTTLHLILSPEIVDHVSGSYWSDCRMVLPNRHLKDDETAKILWTKSLSQLGLKDF